MASEKIKTRFSPVTPKVDFVAIEKRLQNWWNDQGVIDSYLKRNSGSGKRFSFIDGPITANNPMGVHHAWGRAYKDLFLRFKTMQGYEQRYQNGFDGQGLWVEVEVEKELGFKSKRDIEKYGVGRFVEDCKARVRKYAEIMTDQSKRLGYWMDWSDSYHTMSDENNYTIWSFLKICHERGWLYEGTDVMPWCTRCGTGLSQHEILTEGYREIEHPGLFVKFPIVDRPGEALLVWTTTPWTLTSNVAAGVHPDHVYVKVRQGDEILHLGKSRLSVIRGKFEVIEETKGSSLVGLSYMGPFDNFPVQKGVQHRVVDWDLVGEDEGTGIVHMAPGAGAEDFRRGQELGLDVIAPLDEFGHFKDGFLWLEGKDVAEATDPIIASLKEHDRFYHVEPYLHRYPVCWRCDTELVFRLVDEWFISMDELRPQMIEVTGRINWVPGFGLDRELDWLRNMHDWMISKKRYWGLALPIYKCRSCGRVDVLGSETELERRAVTGWEEFEGHSPHRPWLDAVKIACSECGEMVSRISDVGTPWLDAGIVPFSTIGYRQDREYWSKWFPADWISESFPGQFRNWFYSLLVMSVALEQTEPFRNVFTYALLRDEHGAEMHKSKGNAIWFEEAADKMGVDVMRWMYVRHNPANNLSFGYAAGDDVRRLFLIPLWNVYSFFVTYANLDGWSPGRGHTYSQGNLLENDLDRWVISELNVLVVSMTKSLDDWRPAEAARAAESFVDRLSNWYVRRSRRRFWKSESDSDKESAYQTLYTCLTTLVRLLAPFVPFVVEEMYQNLVAERVTGAVPSVHLAEWPIADKSLVDEDLTLVTRLAMRLASLGRSARASAGLKVRQPLAELVVQLRENENLKHLERACPQLLDELNVKLVRDAREIGGLTDYIVKPNLPRLGGRYGQQIPAIRQGLKAMKAADVAASVANGEKIQVSGIDLDPEDILVEPIAPEGYSVASDGGYAVGVSLEVTPELADEGVTREIVHVLQNIRRSAGFNIEDRIYAYIEASDGVSDALRRHEKYLAEEVLADQTVFARAPKGATLGKIEINGEEVILGVERV